VLLIDDSPEDRYAFRRFLEHDQEQSFLCYEAASAAEGLAQCRERRPDAVLLDYHLPDDEGLALLATLIAEHGLHAFAMLLVTGQGSEKLAVAAMKLGAHDYLVKDVHLQHHLGRAVASAIERVRLQRALATSNAYLQHTEQALRIERDRFVTLVETVPGVVCAYRQRPDGTVSFPYASPRIAEIYGLSPEALAHDASTITDLWHPDDVPRLLDTIELSRQQMTPWHEEFRVRNPARGERWIEVHSIPQREADGSTIWYGLLTDITERKQAEQASRESEERLRIVTEAAQVGMVIVDQQHRYRFANQAYATIFGLPSADIVGQRVADVLAPVYEAQIRPRLERAFQGESVHYELVLPPVTPDVHERFYIVQYEPSTYRSARVVIVTVVEISQHKRAEEQLHQQADLLDQVSDAIISVDTHFAIKSWNAAAEALYGWPAREVIGKSLHEILPTEYLDSDANQSLALLSAQGYWQGEIIQPHRDGTRFTILSSVRPVTNRAGKITGAVGINRDITERKRAEAQLQRSEERFRNYFELGQVGMAIASPSRYFLNVNNQLCTILGYAREELLQREWSSLTHPDDLPDDIVQLQRVLGGEIDSFSRDKRFLHKNGRVIYALVSVKAMRRADGTAESLLVLIQDITLRKEAEQALAHSAERLHILASASRAFAEAGQEYHSVLTLIARVISEQLGTTTMITMLSNDGAWLQDNTHYDPDPAVRATLQQIFGQMRLSIQSQAAIAVVVRQKQPLLAPHIDPAIIRATVTEEQWSIFETLHPHSSIIVPLQAQGQAFGALSLMRCHPNQPPFGEEDLALAQDLADRAGLAIANAQLLARVQDELAERTRAETALRESEARFRQLAESLPQLIWTCGSNGLCDYLSPQWVAYTGIPAAEQLGLGWLAQLHPDEREEVADAWQAALDSGSDWAHEFRIRRHDGEYRWFDTRGVRLKDTNGRTIKWFGSNTDIQEQREYQQTLNRYASQLQQLSHKLVEAQETERRRIAHELHDQIGQSLTGLKLSLDSTDTLPLAELSAQLGEARQVINELLGRVRTLSLDLRPSMLDDLGLLPALNWLIERYAAQTGVRVDWRHKGVERRFPTAIETSVYRIVQEALTNVARHAGVAVVELRLLADDERLLLQIADEGRGFNVEDARQSQQSVGLLGMHERVELVGGTIVVDSEPGQGTHVSIVFPLGSLEP
jgi:PAS domain S-box-containing protein